VSLESAGDGTPRGASITFFLYNEASFDLLDVNLASFYFDSIGPFPPLYLKIVFCLPAFRDGVDLPQLASTFNKMLPFRAPLRSGVRRCEPSGSCFLFLHFSRTCSLSLVCGESRLIGLTRPLFDLCGIPFLEDTPSSLHPGGFDFFRSGHGVAILFIFSYDRFGGW